MVCEHKVGILVLPKHLWVSRKRRPKTEDPSKTKTYKKRPSRKQRPREQRPTRKRKPTRNYIREKKDRSLFSGVFLIALLPICHFLLLSCLCLLANGSKFNFRFFWLNKFFSLEKPSPTKRKQKQKGNNNDNEMINNKIKVMNMWCSGRLFGCPCVQSVGVWTEVASTSQTKLYTFCGLILYYPLMGNYDNMTRKFLFCFSPAWHM